MPLRVPGFDGWPCADLSPARSLSLSLSLSSFLSLSPSPSPSRSLKCWMKTLKSRHGQDIHICTSLFRKGIRESMTLRLSHLLVWRSSLSASIRRQPMRESTVTFTRDFLRYAAGLHLCAGTWCTKWYCPGMGD